MSQLDEMPEVFILAGGLGTRLGALSAETPKSLIPIAGRPFLLYQLEFLASQGVRRVVLCVGHLGHLIQEQIGSSQFEIEIAYSYDSPELDGTLGALRRATRGSTGEVLVLYGDTYLPIEFGPIVTSWHESGLPGFMTILHNRDQFDRSNVVFDGRLIVKYDKEHPTPAMEWIDYGLFGIRPELIGTAPRSSDLAELFSQLARHHELLGIPMTARFYEIGTPRSLAMTTDYLLNRREAHNEDRAQKPRA